ncbi:MAG: hydrolase [Propionibacteriaceae bacterium]|jgi:predicted amidohydrolase|nr:hydrolase [Propionibacteriaceae bacterium]
MRVAAIRLDGGADPTRNRQALVEAIAAAAATGAEVVIGPEYANGFRFEGPDPSLAEALDGPTVRALQAAGAAADVLVLTGFLATSDEPGKALGCALALPPGRPAVVTGKLHLFDALGGQESRSLVRPVLERPSTVAFRGLTWGSLICFDLRFPEVARRLVDAGADALVVPAAWVDGPGKARQWSTLLAARAIENLAYVAGVALAGPGLMDQSLAFDPTGAPCPGRVADGLVLWEFDPAAPAAARRRNPALELRRFTVTARP